MYTLSKSILFFALIILFSCNEEDSSSNPPVPNLPFPNHTIYSGSHIKPSNYSQEQLDTHTQSFYNEWKVRYLKNGCNTNEYYIFSGNEALTISEAQGYGMLIMCYIAGHETQAKTYFDGLFKYYKSHPSRLNPALMDWQQLTCTDLENEGDNSASDGDIDIAFSLLLADKQWGSAGTINYLEEALFLLDAIMLSDVNTTTWTVKLGDWVSGYEPNFNYSTRSSDFITSHFKTFENVTNNSNWNLITNKCYELINSTQNDDTGFIPDFIINVNNSPSPAPANFLEDTYDGAFYYNACRVPWRLGVDYLLTNDTRAHTALGKINTWMSTVSLESISNGYLLDGTALYTWHDGTFIAPLCVGAMLDTDNQTRLNSLYEELHQTNIDDEDYYANTLKLLSLITISGNYWNPIY